MADVFVEWNFETPLGEHDLRKIAHDGNGCRDLYKVRLQDSLLDNEGRRLISHFRAPDAESVRMALRCVDAEIGFLWTGTIHDDPIPDSGNVVVEYELRSSELSDTGKAINDIANAWFEQYGFTLARAIISRDGRRLICLYDAPDAESISVARNMRNWPATSIWSFRRFGAPDQ